MQNLLAISTDNCDTQATPTPSSFVIDLSHSNLQKQQLQELSNRHARQCICTSNTQSKHLVYTYLSGSLPASLKDTVNSQIQDMLDTSVIQSSCSP